MLERPHGISLARTVLAPPWRRWWLADRAGQLVALPLPLIAAPHSPGVTCVGKHLVTGGPQLNTSTSE